MPPEQAASGATSDPEQWRELTLLAGTLKPQEQLELDHQEQLTRLFHEHPLNLRDSLPVHFRCSCSEQRTLTALMALGREELQAMIAEQPVTEVVCQFCNFPYSFSSGQLSALLTEDPIH